MRVYSISPSLSMHYVINPIAYPFVSSVQKAEIVGLKRGLLIHGIWAPGQALDEGDPENGTGLVCRSTDARLSVQVPTWQP